MNILASNSVFTHGFEGLVTIGAIAFAAGLLVGWLAWRKCHTQAERVEKLNSKLKSQIKGLKSED